MPTIQPKPPNISPPLREKWYTCNICGPKNKRIHFNFTSGGTEPTVGETLTGATSGATGVVVDSFLTSGTYAGGNATGYVTLSGGTGVDADTLDWGTDDETINGSTGGAGMMTMSEGWEYTTAVMYPKSQIIERDGKIYCKWHYFFVFTPQDRDEVVMDLSDQENDIRGRDY